MPLPRGNEYDQAVQMPQISFSDPDLKISHVETNPLGLPKPYSGGFTTTFRMQTSSTDWAVRCFTREIQELQKRYQAINNFLSKGQSKYFVNARYLANGIRVGGREYPIIKMQWLNGEPLNNFLSKYHRQKSAVEKLLADFLNLIVELESFGIAHGDLQHGNIIVKNNQLYLIDYDGMFFPELAGLSTNEVGHINYQHPQRTPNHYNKYIDRFATIIIYLGLKAISVEPSLWNKYEDGENILFRKSDFADLQNSELIKDLSSIPELSIYVKRFIGVCYLDFEKIPSLSTFIKGDFSFPTIDLNQLDKIEISRNQYLVLDGTLRETILEHTGEKVEIVGRVTAVRFGTTKKGAPFAFLNMGGTYPKHTFTIVLWSEIINALGISGIKPSDYVSKWVSVTGVVSQFKSRPQLYIEQTTQLKILASLEMAQMMLVQKSLPRPLLRVHRPLTQKPAPIRRTTDKEADTFNRIYKNYPVSPPSTRQSSSPRNTLQNTPISGSPSYLPKTSGRKSNRSGCAAPIIGAFICGGIGATVSSGPSGIFIGIIIGLFIGNFFKD